ncbi:zinc finger protein 106-like isoform X2 [Brienomyrus brachyistius]|uniref:zinc finger protein 106-like isoform X2 n=1 Tax=Brienomyrus brachyistius TaxID=42636 RepID=UPI0020B2AE57|nr:zinc finger protein 106-like isoform X2 [Brienomyrus brachyistius]
MGRERRCILCRTTHNTKQEMEEHLRSMLHHRELENIKGRDCKHECRVCQISVAGLTGYASHISSSLHKFRVAQQEQGEGPKSDEEYFDAELEHLEKQRRKEEEAAAQLEENRRQKQLFWSERAPAFQHFRGPHRGCYPMFHPMQMGRGTPHWQLRPFPPHRGAPGAHHDEGAPQGSGNRHPSQEFLPGGMPGFPNWPARGFGHRGKWRGKKWQHQNYTFSPSRQIFGSYPGKQHRPWGNVNSTQMDIDFTNNQLPMSCSFQHNTKERMLDGYQRPDGKQQAQPASGTEKLPKFGQSRGMANSCGSFCRSPHEQDKQLQEIMWKARKALRDDGETGDVLIPKPHTEGHHWTVQPSTKGNPGTPAGLKSTGTQPDKAGQHPQNSVRVQASSEATKPTSPHASSVQSVQISTSTSEASQEAVPVAPEGGVEGLKTEVEEGRGQEAETSEAAFEQGAREPTTEEGPSSDSDVLKDAPTTASASRVPSLSKLALPASLKRDLSRHMSKAGTHEPNLNIARRIRNIDGQRRPLAEKESGLKPTLRQLISSSGSRRNVNWDQVYQEVSKKKQGQGRGMPRFGIEMVAPVPSDPEVHSLEDPPLSLGFHWEALDEPHAAPPGPSSRKRSLSESNVASGDKALNFPPATGAVPREPPRKSLHLNCEEPRTVPWVSGSHLPSEPQAEGCQKRDSQRGASPVGNPEKTVKEDAGTDSGTEHDDSHGGGTGGTDVTSTVSKTVTKATKVKESTPVGELLTLSLREEELNSSLQTLEDSLVQARMALQAAYMEVQRLLMVKQQITTEMNSLRAKRIEILQGMQDNYENGASPNGMAEASGVPPADSSALPSQPPLAALSSPSVSLSSASPATSMFALKGPSSIKQESLSPTHSNLGVIDSTALGLCPPAPHPAFSSPHTEFPVHSSSPSTSGSRGGLSGAACRDSAGKRLGSPGMLTTEAQAEARSDQAAVAHTECFAAGGSGSGSPHPGTFSTSSKKGSKKKKLLTKKRKRMMAQCENRAGSTESDTDRETPSKAKRKPMEREQDEEAGKPGPSELPLGGASSDDSSSSLAIVDNPEAPPCEVISLNSSEQEEEEEREEPAPPKSPSPPAAPTPPISRKAKQRRLACDEVSSTSELAPAIKTEMPCRKTRSSAGGGEQSSQFRASLESESKQEPSEGSFLGHQVAVTGLQIYGGCLYTCSEDQTVRAFSLVTRQCTAVFEGHGAKVNCLLVLPSTGMQSYLYTGSSDHTIRCYSLKNRQCVQQFCMLDRVLCLHSRWKILYAGLANGSVVSFCLKKNQQLDVFECHGPRAVSCLASTQEGSRRLLLVGSYDSTISVRDARNGLLLRTLKGHTKTVLCMKVLNDLVFSGSSDQSVHAHNIHTGELKHIYKGHSHAVTVVAILGKVMITACLDRLVRIYELQSHDRLQVYGGHTDMVMCMSIHKSMIYTGCYDGSVRAVRLNLMQNYRCWWHGCSLIFGVMTHLHQHLLTDHANPTLQTLKCRWRSCEAFFTSRNGSNRDIPLHIQKHAEEDSSPEPQRAERA